MAKRNALGKGIGALITENSYQSEQDTPNQTISKIDISKIEVNPYQPRTEFDIEKLEELSNSIKELGLIQPLTVRSIDGGRYQLIAGERRFRACKMAKIKEVDVWLKESDDVEMMEMALVENIQREDLNAIEIALSYQQLIDECNLTQEAVSKRVGKKRATVANYLRLLKLSAKVQKGVRDKAISMGHAKALINITDHDTQTMIFDQIIKHGFSVRKVEEIVKKINEENNPITPPKAKRGNFPSEFSELEQHLKQHFATDVSFKLSNRGDGNITIPFENIEELETIIGVFDRLNN